MVSNNPGHNAGFLEQLKRASVNIRYGKNWQTVTMIGKTEKNLKTLPPPLEMEPMADRQCLRPESVDLGAVPDRVNYAGAGL